MKRIVQTTIAFGALLLAPILSGLQTAGAVDAPSPITATATCIEANDSGPATVEVALENHTTQTVVISYVHGFTTAQASNPRFAMEKPEPFATIAVDPDEQVEITAPWDDLREHNGNAGAALVITNLGLVVADCNGHEAPLITTPSNQAIGDDMSEETYASIAVETYGQLQGLRAYPAMYAFLHPDSQAAIDWGIFACSNAAEYGTADNDRNTVFSTEIATTWIGEFDYSVTGKHYDEGVRINYRQSVGSIAQTHETGSSLYLVKLDGQYRPLYGNDPGYINSLPRTCDMLDA